MSAGLCLLLVVRYSILDTRWWSMKLGSMATGGVRARRIYRKSLVLMRLLSGLYDIGWSSPHTQLTPCVTCERERERERESGSYFWPLTCCCLRFQQSVLLARCSAPAQVSAPTPVRTFGRKPSACLEPASQDAPAPLPR